MKTKMNFIAAALLTGFILTGIASSAEGSKIKASGRENNVEEAISLETWMTNDEIWQVKTTENRTETDEALAIENWMIENFTFDVSDFTEAPVGLENWMTDENNWILNEAENALALEPWMTENGKWNAAR